MTRRCPDTATCGHQCEDRCWRVGACGPLSGAFPGDRWPRDVLLEHTDAPDRRLSFGACHPDLNRVIEVSYPGDGGHAEFRMWTGKEEAGVVETFERAGYLWRYVADLPAEREAVERATLRKVAEACAELETEAGGVARELVSSAWSGKAIAYGAIRAAIESDPNRRPTPHPAVANALRAQGLPIDDPNEEE